jgi:hypothetical protein
MEMFNGFAGLSTPTWDGTEHWLTRQLQIQR